MVEGRRTGPRVAVDRRPNAHLVGPTSAVDRLRAWQVALDAAGVWASLRWADRAAWWLQAEIHERLLRAAGVLIVLVAGAESTLAVGLGLAARLPVVAVVPERPPGRSPAIATTGRLTILVAAEHANEQALAAHVAAATRAALDGAAEATDPHVAILRRRAAYLETAIRTAPAQKVLTHDRAELAALDWALWRIGATA